MIVTITLSPEQETGLNFATNKRNNANSSSSPMTNEEFAEDLLKTQLNSFAGEARSFDRATMTPIADALIAAPQSVREKILSSATAELKKQGLL